MAPGTARGRRTHPEEIMARDDEEGTGDHCRPAHCPAREEDGINLLKAAERAGNEGWAPDASGGYTDRDGRHRDAYGERDRHDGRRGG
jgi:hypothetical protein